MGVQLPIYDNDTRSAVRISTLFVLGDALFLMTVGSASTFAMHLVHTFAWNIAVTLTLAMAVAMAVQLVLAAAAAPLLGSIETMVPSMIVGMLSPMQLCAVELVGYHETRRMAVLAGAAFGLATLVLLQLWGQWRYLSLRRTTLESEVE